MRSLAWFLVHCAVICNSAVGCAGSDPTQAAGGTTGVAAGGASVAAAGSGGHAGAGLGTSTGGSPAAAGGSSVGGSSGASATQNGGSTAAGGQATLGGSSGNNGSGGGAGAVSSGGAGAVSSGGAAGSGGGLANGGSGGSVDPNAPYIFATFGDASRLLIYTATDALNFKLLSDTNYAGPSGTLRDPSIMKYSDGKFYVTFTTPPTASCCGAESSFGIASSADLVHWTTLTTVNSGIAGVKNTWAPEWFKDLDGSLSLIVNIDTNEANSFRTYRYQARNAALTAFSAPTAIGIGPNYIDTFIVIVGQTYHAFTKNETTLYIEHATAPSVTGPWTFVGKADWAGWGTHREAPALIHLPNGTWRIFVDGGSQGHEMYSDSKDTFASWSALKALPVISATVSHGTVIQSALP